MNENNSKQILLLNKKSKKISKNFSELKLITRSNYAIFASNNYKQKKYNAIKIFPKKEHNSNICHHEYEIGVKLNHQNIIQTYELKDKIITLGPLNYECYALVMEFAPFGDLFSYAKYTTLEEDLVRTIFHQIIDGVEYLHKNFVCHLDLKIENIAFGEKFIPKIIDFGHSQKLQNPDELLDRFEVGTKLIKPPELWKYTKYSGFKVDIFGLGIILYSMLTSSLPFEIGAKKTDDAYKFLFQKNPDRFFEINKRKMEEHSKKLFDNPDLRLLILKMLQPDPDQRGSLEDIKESAWFKGPILNQNDYLKIMMEKLFEIKALKFAKSS